MLRTLFGSFWTIYSSLEIFSDLFTTRNNFCDLLYIRNTIKIRTILRICSQYVLYEYHMMMNLKIVIMTGSRKNFIKQACRNVLLEEDL